MFLAISWPSCLKIICENKLDVRCVGVMLGAILESLWKNVFGFGRSDSGNFVSLCKVALKGTGTSYTGLLV